jgi:hypothetical protein
MMCSRNVTIVQNEELVSIAVFIRKWMLFVIGLTCNACGGIAYNSVYSASNVYKKGNKSVPNNYRGITLISIKY